MGYLPRCDIVCPCHDSIHASIDTHISTEACRRTEYPYDVYHGTRISVHDHRYRIQASQKTHLVQGQLLKTDRPGTNWTSWFTFLVAGIMQGGLLAMCVMWKFRQRRLGIDDFGNLVVVERTPLIRK